MNILEILWYIVTLAIPVLGIVGGIFGLFAIPAFLVIFFICVGLSIVLGYITGHLEFGRMNKG